MSTAQWTCQSSYLATPLHPGSSLFESTVRVQSAGAMLWQEGQEVQQGVKSQTSQKDATLPEKTVTFDQFCDSRRLENLEKKKKKNHYSLAPSWASVQTEGGGLHNILKTKSEITEECGTQCICSFSMHTSQIDCSVRNIKTSSFHSLLTWMTGRMHYFCLYTSVRPSLPRTRRHASASLFKNNWRHLIDCVSLLLSSYTALMWHFAQTELIVIQSFFYISSPLSYCHTEDWCFLAGTPAFKVYLCRNNDSYQTVCSYLWLWILL